MRGKRKLRKIETMSTDTNHVYECDMCIWMMETSPDQSPIEVELEFNAHDCKANSLKYRPVRPQLAASA